MHEALVAAEGAAIMRAARGSRVFYRFTGPRPHRGHRNGG